MKMFAGHCWRRALSLSACRLLSVSFLALFLLPSRLGAAPAPASPADSPAGAPPPAVSLPAVPPLEAPAAPGALARPPEDAASAGKESATPEELRELETAYAAALKGDARAMNRLGLLFDRGLGVEPDAGRAVYWFARAAAAGDPAALARLGHFFRTGTGVAKNIPRATLLLHGAAMCGNEDAIRELRELAAEKPAGAQAVMFGQRLDATDRPAMRAALRAAGLRPTREDNAFVCDVYDPAGKVPGAAQVAACYGPAQGGAPARLGFLKIDYPASGPEFLQRLNGMITDRFGPEAAGEAGDARLWNLGGVIIATQYMPDHRQVGLMYMVPEVYHLTRSGAAGNAP